MTKAQIEALLKIYENEKKGVKTFGRFSRNVFEIVEYGIASQLVGKGLIVRNRRHVLNTTEKGRAALKAGN